MPRLECNANEVDSYDNKLFAEWQEKYRLAVEHMTCCSNNSGVLIEVAAQHPLRDGMHPNEEFATRLDLAIELFWHAKKQEDKVSIYVPGSIHMVDGISDCVSLSQAGCSYLEERGIPRAALFGDDANAKYKGDIGVYNSSDECYVATCLFNELEFGKLYSVYSPAQLMRKALSYIEFGCLPKMYSVPVETMFHNYVDEVFLYIPRLLDDGNGLQSNSEEADRLRELRKPE